MQATTNSYAGCFGFGGQIGSAPDQGNGLFIRNGELQFRDVTDGTSQTLAIGERAARFAQSPWIGVVDQGTLRTTPGVRSISRLWNRRRQW